MAVSNHENRGSASKPRAARDFCTPVHRYAQVCNQNLIDVANEKLYLAFQIGPGSFKNFTAQFKGRNKLNGGCVARLNRRSSKPARFGLESATSLTAGHGARWIRKG